MRERSLLERLRDPKADEGRRASDDLDALEASILAHLRRMLNSRQGHALVALDYGMPDLSEALRTYPSSLSTVEQAVRASIEKYEPRLRDVSVRFVDSEEDILTLSFEIRGRLARDRKLGLQVTTRIGPDGGIELVG
jgi:type VI secretion system protein